MTSDVRRYNEGTMHYVTPWPLIGWDILDFSSEATEQKSTEVGRKQDLNILFQVCVFWADQKKMSALVSIWMRQDGRHGLWLAETYWTSPPRRPNKNQRKLAGSKISTFSFKFVFFGRPKKEDGRPGFYLDETFLTSPLKPLYGIQRNLTGSKILTFSTKFVFFWPIRKPRWPSCGLINKGGILYSCVLYVALWAPC